MYRIGFINIIDINSISNMPVYRLLVKQEILNQSTSGLLDTLQSSSCNVGLHQNVSTSFQFYETEISSICCVCFYSLSLTSTLTYLKLRIYYISSLCQLILSSPSFPSPTISAALLVHICHGHNLRYILSWFPYSY